MYHVYKHVNIDRARKKHLTGVTFTGDELTVGLLQGDVLWKMIVFFFKLSRRCYFPTVGQLTFPHSTAIMLVESLRWLNDVKWK